MSDPLDFASLVDRRIYGRSGSVFYSGRSAFSASSDLYLLGLNPGGSPADQADETVQRDLADWQQLPEEWSAYRDEEWQGRPAGTCGMQPRVLHMLDHLGLRPHEVPASNVVFVRSNNEAALAAEKRPLLESCWPVHEAVIRNLNVSTIVCFGGTAGRWVRERLGAMQRVDSFVEDNLRRWTSEAHRSKEDMVVVTVTHPSRADWTNPASDPTLLVARMISRRR